jgi:amidohydrolase
MELDRTQTAVLEAIDARKDEVLALSRLIHERPELGGKETLASEAAASLLEGAGFAVERGYAGLSTAFRATAGLRGGPRIAFLAEYDALPGIGHGCGHNLICAASVAAGLGLAEAAAAAGGEVLVIGTPAEETDGAKVAMAAQGCFDTVDAALMIHPFDGNFWATESLAMDAIELRFLGKTAHAAASPWEGRNALDALILSFTNINALRQQLRPDARIHGVITEGGVAPNVIPERCVARFYVRAASRGYLDEVVAKFKDCARAAALATGTRLELASYEASFDDMASNEALSTKFRDLMTGALGSGPFGHLPSGFGSIDMGNVSHIVPAMHALVEVTGGRRMSLHTRDFAEAAASPAAEEAALRAASGLALTGLELLRDPLFLAAARADFVARFGREPGRRA